MAERHQEGRRPEAGGSIVAVVWKEMLRAVWGKGTH